MQQSTSGVKTITIGQFLEAMELDNVPLARGRWFKEQDGVTAEACILGQCAINLGVTSDSIQSLLDLAVPYLATKIIGWNDGGTPYDKMVATAKILLAGKEAITYDKAKSTFYLSKLKETT